MVPRQIKDLTITMKKIFFFLLLMPSLVFAQKIDTFRVAAFYKMNGDTSRCILEYSNGSKFDFITVVKDAYVPNGTIITIPRAGSSTKQLFFTYRRKKYILYPYSLRRFL